MPGNGPGGAAARRARPRGLRERASPPPVSGRDRASAAPGPDAAARRARPARRRRSGCCGGSPLPAARPSRQLPPRRTAGLVLGHRTQETASSAGSEGAGRTGLAEAALDSCRAALRWQKRAPPVVLVIRSPQTYEEYVKVQSLVYFSNNRNSVS